MAKARKADGGEGRPPSVVFYCPGCKRNHAVPYTNTRPHTGGLWFWDENQEQPTIEPSLRILTEANGPSHCHVVVTNGVLNYCGDCRHELAGKSVPMQDCKLIDEE